MFQSLLLKCSKRQDEGWLDLWSGRSLMATHRSIIWAGHYNRVYMCGKDTSQTSLRRISDRMACELRHEGIVVGVAELLSSQPASGKQFTAC